MARCNCNPCCYARAACSCDCTCATQPEPATIRDMPYQWNVEPAPTERAGVPDWYSYVPITERHTIEITTGQLISDPDGPWVHRYDVDAALLAALRPDGDKP